MTKLIPKEILKNISDYLEANPTITADLNKIIEDYSWSSSDAGEDDIPNLEEIIKGIDRCGYGMEKITEFIPDLEVLKEYARDDYGAEAYVTFNYKPTNQIVGYEGWYSSEESYQFDRSFMEMEPYQVTHYRKATK